MAPHVNEFSRPRAIAALLLIAALALALVAPAPRAAGAPLGQQAATVALKVVSGPVSVMLPGAAQFAAATDGMAIPQGTAVRTGAGAAAQLNFSDRTQVQLAEATELSIEELTAGLVRIDQTAGTSINRVVASGGRVFETKTPTGVGRVQAATYLATVTGAQSRTAAPPTAPAPRPFVVLFPRVVPDSAFLLTGQAVYAQNGALWEVRSWVEPATGLTWDTFARLGESFPIVDETYYLDAGQLVRKTTFRDPSTGVTWPIYQVLGAPATQSLRAGEHAEVAALRAQQQPDTIVISQIILIRDPDTGLIGQIQIQPALPPNAPAGTPMPPPIVLNAAGQVGTVAHDSTPAGQQPTPGGPPPPPPVTTTATVQLSDTTASQILAAVTAALQGSPQAAAEGTRSVAATTAQVKAILLPAIVPDAIIAARPPTPGPTPPTAVVEGPITVTVQQGETQTTRQAPAGPPPGTAPGRQGSSADPAWYGYSAAPVAQASVLERALLGLRALLSIG